MIKNEKKSSKGITLIALIVTIVVLLILASIGIATLTGNNGLISSTQSAKEKSEIADEKELLEQAVTVVIGKNRNISGEKLKKALNDLKKNSCNEYDEESEPGIINVTLASGRKYSVDKEGNVEKAMSIVTEAPTTAVSEPTKFKDTTSGNKIAVIPEGFRVSSVTGEKTEQSIDKGLVITDGTSEFVWVPVPDVIWDGTTFPSQTYTPMATTQNAESGYYRGMLYEFDGSTSTYLADCTPGTEKFREPDVLGDTDWGDASTGDGKGLNLLNSIVGIPGTIGTDDKQMKDKWKIQLLNEYKEMVESVNKYKGFYVGRYETGILNGNIVSKNASTDTNVTTADASNTTTNTWYGLYQKQKEYANGKNGIKSTMIWGSQYDAMMNWMAKQGKTVGTEDDSKYNNTTITGNKAEDNINNIFDLYGCHWECSIEAIGTDCRVNRNDFYDESGAPGYRGAIVPYDTGDVSGSRLTLFIQ